MEKTTLPYEILIRFNDGSAVAQISELERWTHEGETVSAKITPAKALPVPLAESLLGEVNAGLLTRVAELEAQLLEAQAGAPAQPTTTIRAWQAKAVLALSGLLEAAEAVIDALDEPQRTVVQSAWANNADFSRQSATILNLAAALGITEEQLDAMFLQGAALTV